MQTHTAPPAPAEPFDASGLKELFANPAVEVRKTKCGRITEVWNPAANAPDERLTRAFAGRATFGPSVAGHVVNHGRVRDVAPRVVAYSQRLRTPRTDVRHPRRTCGGRRRPGARRVSRSAAGPPGESDSDGPGERPRQPLLAGRDRLLADAASRIGVVI